MPDATSPSSELRPRDAWQGKFDWSHYLQRHLTSPNVIVSRLHPIFGLRLAALFIELTNDGLASDTPGRGTFQISSAVRTRAHQEALYRQICGREGRCSMVADPDRVHGVDAEGTPRQGSNHMPQEQKWKDEDGDPVYVGYAVDIRNARGTSANAWAPFHTLLPKYGLDWPLKGNPLERWHIEWFPRSRSMPYEGTVKLGGWPKRPGVHRPLTTGHRGGDVKQLQRGLNGLIEAGLIEGPALAEDGVFGTNVLRAVSETRVWLGRPPGRWWREIHQERLEDRLVPNFGNPPQNPPTPAPEPEPEPEPEPQPDPSAEGKAKLREAEQRLRALGAEVTTLADNFQRAREDLP